MTTLAEPSPLFKDLALSADDATAIAAALQDVARSDGEHPEELDMIRGFVEALDLDLGAASPSTLPAMSPEKLALAITDPKVRRVAVECAVLLAWADGVYSDKERACVAGYASALGFSPGDYAAVEQDITSWVQSGDLNRLFGNA